MNTVPSQPAPVPANRWPDTAPGVVTAVPATFTNDRLLAIGPYAVSHPDTVSTRSDGTFVHLSVRPCGAQSVLFIHVYPDTVAKYGWPVPTAWMTSRHVISVRTKEISGSSTVLTEFAHTLLTMTDAELGGLTLIANWGNFALGDVTAALLTAGAHSDEPPVDELTLATLVRLFNIGGQPLLQAAVRAVRSGPGAERLIGLRAFLTAAGSAAGTLGDGNGSVPPSS